MDGVVQGAWPARRLRPDNGDTSTVGVKVYALCTVPGEEGTRRAQFEETNKKTNTNASG